MTERSTSEWPLVIFTIAVQLASGLALAATLADLTAQPAEAALMRPLGMAISPLVAVGIPASLLHLGRPFDAWKSFLNLGQSRLSREVLLTALFAAVSLIYGLFWLTDTTETRAGLGIATTACGLVAVMASSVIYLLPSQPVWNSGWLPASFLGTTLLLGGAAPAALGPPFAESQIFLIVIVAGSALLMVSACWMLARLVRVGGESAPLLRPRQVTYLVLYLALAIPLPAAMIGGVVLPLAFGAFPLVVFGTIFGRLLMYEIAISAPRF